jgi:hypothetical protein
MAVIPMIRSRARLCSLRPQAEEYGPQPISACFFGILFVLILFFSEDFFGFVFYPFAGIFSLMVFSVLLGNF